jgi:hypothetical protein
MDQSQGCASSRRKADQLGQEGRPALAPPGPLLSETREAVSRLFETVAPRYGDVPVSSRLPRRAVPYLEYRPQVLRFEEST